MTTFQNSKPSQQEEVRSVWTQEDEARLLELNERKQRIVGLNRERVFNLVVGFGFRNPETDDITDSLIRNAKQIREALKPFDEVGNK